MFGDNHNDAQLKDSWDNFCDQLKKSGDLVFRDTTPTHDIDRAKGFRLLARNISLALQFHLENNDPDFPELLHYFDPIRKQGGDNTDALYVGAPINGEHTYKISGQRGSARYFAVTIGSASCSTIHLSHSSSWSTVSPRPRHGCVNLQHFGRTRWTSGRHNRITFYPIASWTTIPSMPRLAESR